MRVVGKHTYVPSTGHTDPSFTVEQWFSDISQSEVYTGLKPASMSLDLPSTGLVGASFSFMGRDLHRQVQVNISLVRLALIRKMYWPALAVRLS